MLPKVNNCICARDAWSRHGDMEQEVAMLAYVEELKKVLVAVVQISLT